MCGIAGIKRLGDKPIFDWELKMLLTSLEYRGNDASGIALSRRDGSVDILKDDEPAWKFCSTNDYARFIKDHLDNDVEIAVVHTRKATKGSPHRHENNHPLFAGKSVVVHNGQIRNDDSLFRDMKMERKADTDSDVIRAIVDRYGITKKAIQKLNKLEGTVAAAILHPDNPGTVLLLRSGNPLVMGSTPEKLYWASDKRTIYRVAKPWVSRANILMQLAAPDLAFVNMHNDSAWIIGAKGLEFHDKFQLTGNYGGNIAYRIYETGNYLERKKRFAAPTHEVATFPLALSPKFVYCPNQSCLGDDNKQRTLIEIDSDQRKLPLYQLVCRKCQTNLALAEPKLETVS